MSSSTAAATRREGEERDWTTSFLLFAFWAGLMYYVFFLAPNQTPVTDMYFVKKLLNLKGDDGYEMNQVLVALWYIMGLWPLVYSMLLFPTAEDHIGCSARNNGLCIFIRGDVWREFYQYFQGSKFIHITSIDFVLLSTFAPFWIYNDLTARNRDVKGSSWLLPLSLVPFLGPSLYLLLRPSLPVAREPTSDEAR